MSDVSIGIDLGTRNALAAFVGPSGLVEVIPNRWGSLVTPSVVGWEKGQWLVGEDAARLELRGSGDVWWDLKRKVGTPFRVTLGGMDYRAQDLLTPLLTALREDAEVRLRAFVSSCVLAVPACFSLAQREAMVLAAGAAGLTKARVVAEPAAAALAFGQEGRFLILDFGAGTTDLSVVESEGGVWQVLESLGTDTIGGYEFDVALADWLKQRLLLEDTPLLLREAERIKIALSECRSYQWTSPAGGRSLTVEREDVERLVRFPMRRLAHTVRRLWNQYQPQHLLLVGGSSRIPLLKDILAQEVAQPERLSLCAEDAVVRGAALCAGGRLLLDAFSGDLLAIWEGRPHTLISSESALPARAELGLRATRTGRGTLELRQTRGELQREDASLASLNLDVNAGELLSLSCELSASGRFAAALQRETGERVGIPLALEDQSTDRKLRELQLALVDLEPSLTRAQQDRLHLLFQKAGGVSDPGMARLMEDLVQDVRQAVGSS